MPQFIIEHITSKNFKEILNKQPQARSDKRQATGNNHQPKHYKHFQTSSLMEQSDSQAAQIESSPSSYLDTPTPQIPNTEVGALWRQVTEEEKVQIKQEAKYLLTEFASKLKKISAKDSHLENFSGTRREGTGWKTDEEFKSTTFANAPFIENNFLVAEKGAWKK